MWTQPKIYRHLLILLFALSLVEGRISQTVGGNSTRSDSCGKLSASCDTVLWIILALGAFIYVVAACRHSAFFPGAPQPYLQLQPQAPTTQPRFPTYGATETTARSSNSP